MQPDQRRCTLIEFSQMLKKRNQQLSCTKAQLVKQGANAAVHCAAHHPNQSQNQLLIIQKLTTSVQFQKAHVAKGKKDIAVLQQQIADLQTERQQQSKQFVDSTRISRHVKSS